MPKTEQAWLAQSIAGAKMSKFKKNWTRGSFTSDPQPPTPKMAVWHCQMCLGKYSSLYDLVSHVRAVHYVDVLGFACQVNGCTKMFYKTNTWYKHVVQSHHEEYFNGSNSSEVAHDEDMELNDDTHTECSVDASWPEDNHSIAQ